VVSKERDLSDSGRAQGGLIAMRGIVATVQNLADWAAGNPIPLLVVFTVAGMFLIATSARRG
jgi:hypothetical protein